MATFLHRTTKQFAADDGTGDLGPAYIRNPDLSRVAAEPVKYWVVEGDSIRAATAGERTTIDTQLATDEAAAIAALIAKARQDALAEIAASKDATIVALRGAVEALAGLFNKQVIWVGKFQTALANSATFAAFKTSMATIQAPPVVSKADVRQAIGNEINAGKADS